MLKSTTSKSTTTKKPLQKQLSTHKRQFTTTRKIKSKTTPKNIKSSLLTTSKRTWLSAPVPVHKYKGPIKTPDELYQLYEVTPERSIPEHIPRPDYAFAEQSGVPRITGSRIAEIKSNDDIEKMRVVCSMASYIREYGSKFLRPGITTDEIDAIVHDEIIRLGAYPSPLRYHGFPKSLCTSVNNVICHGIPDKRPLQNGDIINLDITLFYDGFHGDCSATFPVGDIDDVAQKLIHATKLSMQNGIAICHPGQNFRQIGLEVQRVADANNFGINTMFAGHGIGKQFHQAPEILHCRNNVPGMMATNMTFTIEPILNESLWTDVVHHKDEWTILTPDGSRSAQFEETVRITDDGVEVLTVHKPGYYDKKM